MQRSSIRSDERWPWPIGNEEKQLVLSALGNIPTIEALALVASQFGNTAIREEACTAAVSIAEKFADSRDARMTAVMQQVAKLTANKELAARAAAIAAGRGGK